MKITRDMKIKEVLAFGEEKIVETLGWMAPEFERLRHPKLRRAMSGRVTVEQAAKIARIPLTEMLYVLNLAVGEEEAELSSELFQSPLDDFEYKDANLPIKPFEIADLKDTDQQRVVFVDLMPQAAENRDPMPQIAKGLASLKNPLDVLLIRHPFDPIPLREMFARRHNLASWAEERKPGEWFVYFYHPFELANVAAHPPVRNKIFLKAMAAFA
jgi:hypothetical protein